MSKVSNWLYIAAASFAVISCGGSDKKEAASGVSRASLEGTLPSSEYVLARYDNNMMLDVDTLKAENNKFKFDFAIKKGHPEFVYVISGDDVVVPVLLEADAEVKVDIDADGNVKLEGSEASLKLMESQKEYYAVSAKLDSLAAQIESASKAKSSELVSEMGRVFLDYHKAANRYVMENSHSMTVIPVLYRRLPFGAQMRPVFNEETAPYLYRMIADSLAENYPDSRYVKALRAASEGIFNQREIQKLVDNTEASGYLDIELPGLDGKNKKLSDVDSKVILLYFWTSEQAKQNLFNVEILKPIYDKYHSKGFDIYQVSLDTDKVHWATTIMGQDLPWTNVCDTRGAASQYVSLYNLYYQTEDGNVGIALPSAFVIHNGDLIDGQIVDEASFRKLLDKLLK
jgi:peroxiredoxin